MSLAFLAAEAPNLADKDTRVFIVAAPAVQLLVALLIPLAVGLITKYTLPGWIKATLTIILNAVNTLVVTSITADGTALFTQTMLMTWALNTAISIAIYHGLYRPAGLTSSTPNGALSPKTGIGPTPPNG